MPTVCSWVVVRVRWRASAEAAPSSEAAPSEEPRHFAHHVLRERGDSPLRVLHQRIAHLMDETKLPEMANSVMHLECSNQPPTL